MESHWYVVQVMSGREKQVKKYLEDGREVGEVVGAIEEVLVPSKRVSEMKRGERKISEKRFWPGYILVKMQLTDESWMYVKKTSGVIGFLGGGKPHPLSPAEEEEVLGELHKKKDEVVHKHQFMVGNRVKIVDGVFVNFIGTVLEVNYERGRLSAMVAIFGRDTRVDDLEFWQVEEVASDADA